MNVKHKQRAVIEFLLLEGRAGEIVIRLRNLYNSVVRWIGEVRRRSEEFRNEGRPEDPIDTKLRW
jgi:transposase-like protein